MVGDSLDRSITRSFLYVDVKNSDYTLNRTLALGLLQLKNQRK